MLRSHSGRAAGAARRRPLVRVGLAAYLAWVVPGAVPPGLAAHEIPTDVMVRIFVKAEEGRLRVLVRVPLESMRDVDFPLTGGDYLDVPRAGAALRQAAGLWIADEMRFHADGRLLQAPRVELVRASIPTDRSFAGWESALAHVTGPGLDEDTWLVWRQALLDVLLEVPLEEGAEDLVMEPGVGRLGVRVTTVLRYLPQDGTERAFQIHGDPGRLRLDPRWRHAAGAFVAMGFRHILGGLDHLLFLLCLVIPFRRFGALVVVVTAFTLAHSVTLAAAALGHAPDALWFPPLVETLIAASIVYMALENMLGAALLRRWVIAFAFGLVHGFGFSFALEETLQFAGRHLVTSLVAFNVGVELGQVAVLAVLVPGLALLFKAVPEKAGAIVLSAVVAHTGWHWMVERWTVLAAFEVSPGEVAGAFASSGLRWPAAVLILASLAWVLVRRFPRRGSRKDLAEDPGGP